MTDNPLERRQPMDAAIQMDAYNTGGLFPNFEKNSDEQMLLHQRCSEWFSRRIDRLTHESATSTDSVLNRITCINVDVVRIRLKELLLCLESSPDTSLWTALRAWDQDSAATATGSDEQQKPNFGLLQAAFLLLGWLSMVYEPKLAPHKLRLEIVLPNNRMATVKLSSRFRKQLRWQAPTESIEIERYAAMSFPRLLPHFGLRLPTIANDPNDGGNTPLFGNIVNHAQIDSLVTASNIYYSNLHRVGKIQVQWVHDIVHHLDFDERNRTLSLFKFPTYCALICLSDPQSTKPLSRLISDVGDDYSGTDDSDETRNQPFDDYCREVLITLGIIFAQEGRSRKELLKRADGNWRTPADPAW
ncbi:hypothetical protein B0T24DRAFT_681829 [Lasiosphaeria ovina]|uniref:Uncharacterized protein n=1 Tax=Lasiosphaeria ovina TaxID=92902 RepID=A0AAE0N0Y3_9PEZI|nr:hypothetical protein B0T24DRAFT_681829 [Lasiosphaeria ovina]